MMEDNRTTTNTTTTNSKEDYIIVAICSIGIKVTGGQLMNEKWNIHRKGYLMIHVSADIKSKKVLSVVVTDGHLHNNKMFVVLVNDVLKAMGIDRQTFG